MELSLHNAPKGRCPFGNPARGFAPEPYQRALPSGLLRRAFGPLDTHSGVLRRIESLAGVTARNGRAATRSLRRGDLLLRARSTGFAIIITFDFCLRRTRHWQGVALCTSSRPDGCIGRKPAAHFSCRITIFLHPEECEGFQRAIAKPFGRARQRETPAPQSPRRGAPVARRDPCKRTCP